MSISVKRYVSLIHERKDMSKEIRETFESYGGWAVLAPPRNSDKSDRIIRLSELLNKFVSIDKELAYLEKEDGELPYQGEDTESEDEEDLSI